VKEGDAQRRSPARWSREMGPLGGESRSMGGMWFPRFFEEVRFLPRQDALQERGARSEPPASTPPHSVTHDANFCTAVNANAPEPLRDVSSHTLALVLIAAGAASVRPALTAQPSSLALRLHVCQPQRHGIIASPASPNI
jgi:hypothetical protein